MLLPKQVNVLLFDMDGVLTDTASVHAQAWKETFDATLKELGRDDTFDAGSDYQRYVDGKPRLDGVRSFMQSRDIDLPEGSDGDSPDELTVNGVGTRKNDRVLELIRKDGVKVYDGSVDFVRAARGKGYKCAVVSSSANTHEALGSVGIEDLFDVFVEGTRIKQENIKGKPAPDTFLLAAKECGGGPEDAAVFEDAISGVEAGRAGDFGLVVGVDRVGHAEALSEHGADVVVKDLDEIQLP